MRGCLKAFLIVNVVIVTAILIALIGIYLAMVVKSEKAKAESPDGKYCASWYGNDISTAAFFFDTKKKSWSELLWSSEEVHSCQKLICLEEGHFHPVKYHCYWKSNTVCVFTIKGSSILGISSYSKKCNVETLACVDVTEEENRARAKSRSMYPGP